jgi:hypothetical protein
VPTRSSARVGNNIRTWWAGPDRDRSMAHPPVGTPRPATNDSSPDLPAVARLSADGGSRATAVRRTQRDQHPSRPAPRCGRSALSPTMPTSWLCRPRRQSRCRPGRGPRRCRHNPRHRDGEVEGIQRVLRASWPAFARLRPNVCSAFSLERCGDSRPEHRGYADPITRIPLPSRRYSTQVGITTRSA